MCFNFLFFTIFFLVANLFFVEIFCERGDVVQVETWVRASGRNGMRRDWLIRDYNTGESLLRATG